VFNQVDTGFRTVAARFAELAAYPNPKSPKMFAEGAFEYDRALRLRRDDVAAYVDLAVKVAPEEKKYKESLREAAQMRERVYHIMHDRSFRSIHPREEGQGTPVCIWRAAKAMVEGQGKEPADRAKKVAQSVRNLNTILKDAPPTIKRGGDLPPTDPQSGDVIIEGGEVRCRACKELLIRDNYHGMERSHSVSMFNFAENEAQAHFLLDGRPYLCPDEDLYPFFTLPHGPPWAAGHWDNKGNVTEVGDKDIPTIIKDDLPEDMSDFIGTLFISAAKKEGVDVGTIRGVCEDAQTRITKFVTNGAESPRLIIGRLPSFDESGEEKDWHGVIASVAGISVVFNISASKLSSGAGTKKEEYKEIAEGTPKGVVPIPKELVDMTAGQNFIEVDTPICRGRCVSEGAMALLLAHVLVQRLYKPLQMIKEKADKVKVFSDVVAGLRHEEPSVYHALHYTINHLGTYGKLKPIDKLPRAVKPESAGIGRANVYKIRQAGTEAIYLPKDTGRTFGEYTI
jgi:hypothetical protein